MRLQLRRVSGQFLQPVFFSAFWPPVSARLFCVGGVSRPLHCPTSVTADMLQVELLMPDNDATNEEDHDMNGFFGEEEHGTSGDDNAAAETVTSIDAFARAKVANFFKRMSSFFASTSLSSNLVTEVREVQSAGDDESLFHARLRIPLPSEYGERWGEGLAPTAKEAELVAAMHAERVIDALGFSMFQLTSKQRRHAEAARCAGRWAPMPGESPRPPTTPSPPRLQLLPEGTTNAVERRLQIDKMVFSEVTAGSFTAMKLTLASPFFFDYGSVYRVKQFFAAYNCNIQRYSCVTALHKCCEKVDSGGTSVAGCDSKKMFFAQLKLPIDARFGERMACGKAETKKEAMTLACMHAELIIDALGLALYPNRPELQETHAEECRKVNRWCSRPNEYDYHYTRESPPPLQLVKHRSAMATAEEVGFGTSLESVLLLHAKAIKNFTNVVEIPALVPSARREFLNYIAQHSGSADNESSIFFVEALGVKDHETYRATVTVPVKFAVNEKVPTQSVDTSEIGAGYAQQSFVSIGIGTSQFGAEVAASMHALSILEQLNCYPPCTEKGRRQQQQSFCDTVISPPYRHVVGHIGRVVVPGLNGTKSVGDLSANKQRCGFSAKNQELRISSARAELPKSDWSLDADAQGYIIVDPGVNVQDGRNYVHTLPSVRKADRFAIVRLRDYLERHGKRLESDSILSTFVETDNGLKRWVTKVTLPVPETFGHVVAHGEAYTEEEALVMCAVHAELVLDVIGVTLYDFDILQEKHCAVAEMLGRRAPYKTQLTPGVVHIPPPVRKEHADSTLWAELSKKCRTVKNDTLYSNGTVADTLIKTDFADKSTTTSGHEEESTDLNMASATADGECLLAKSSSSCLGEKVADDVLCDLEGLVHVHSSEIFRHAFRLLDMYCKRKDVNISCSMRQYSVRNPTYGLVHRAIFELPVPSQFGRRYAVGCASTKKDAFGLCCMHAVFILGELGIPIYTGYKQEEYAAIARSRGRYAPRPGDPLRPGNTKSPAGFKNFPDADVIKPRAPTPPDCAECHKPFVWGSYVSACRGYLQKMKEYVVFDALFVQGKAPRSGVEVEDKTLEIVEALPLVHNTKSKLSQKCISLGLPPPPPTSFRFEVYGRQPNRRYMVEQSILGTPFVACGIGEGSQEAITRAAMHYEYILGIIGGTDSHRCGGTGVVLRNRNSNIFDSILCDFTPRGKLSIMVLYTILRAPFVPLRLTLKERSGGTSDASQLIYVSLVELEDESGLRMAGKGETLENAEEARSRAIAELYRQLQRKSTFQTVVQLLQLHPELCVEGAAHLLSEENIFARLRSLLSQQKELQELQPLLSLQKQQQQQQLHSSDAFRQLLNVGYLASIIHEMDAGYYLHLLEVRVLFDIAGRTLGSAVASTSVSLPLPAQRLLARMGLVTIDKSDDGLKLNAEANAVGIATTLFVLSLPPPTVSCEDGNQSMSGALCLQLAKLLLAGSLMDCLHLCVRVAALVLFLTTDAGSGAENKVWGGGGDVLRVVSGTLPRKVQHIAAVIAGRLAEISAKVSRNSSTPQCALSTLAASMCLSPDIVWDGPLKEELTLAEEGRLRFAIAFATFPDVFVQKKAASDNISCTVTVESRDCQRRARVLVPETLTESHTFSLHAAPSCLSFSRSSNLSTSSSLSSFSSCYSSFPCFCVFSTNAKTGAIEKSFREEEVPLFGTFISPCGLLLATATWDESRAVVVTEDVPNIALVDGFVPVVMRSSESIVALVELRFLLKLRWGNMLLPLSEETQRVMDELLVARHSLTHVVQAELLT